ncbi:RICIN domain-containing protein [Saccharothrix deserti]|uniref:RICIN domain-containing protein n=1 Tax=Saccharothrix deserti TaxID=2593674 RepID=UPI001EE3F802|nr:RICIN domain-containing protein [Saccharothrix deserti]
MRCDLCRDRASARQRPQRQRPGQRRHLADGGTTVGALRAAGAGKRLEVNGASTTDGAKVILWTCHSGSNQQWALVWADREHQARPAGDHSDHPVRCIRHVPIDDLVRPGIRSPRIHSP